MGISTTVSFNLVSVKLKFLVIGSPSFPRPASSIASIIPLEELSIYLRIILVSLKLELPLDKVIVPNAFKVVSLVNLLLELKLI